MTWRAGIDVLCFGGTKNGMAAGEAILFFDRKLAEDFDYRCKQAGQLASKMRFLSAPWVGMIETGAWLRNAAHGNECAARLSRQISGLARLEIMFPVQANAVFVRIAGGQAGRASRAGLAVLHLHRRRGPGSCSHGIARRSGWTCWRRTSSEWQQIEAGQTKGRNGCRHSALLLAIRWQAQPSTVPGSTFTPGPMVEETATRWM